MSKPSVYTYYAVGVLARFIAQLIPAGDRGGHLGGIRDNNSHIITYIWELGIFNQNIFGLDQRSALLYFSFAFKTLNCCLEKRYIPQAECW